MSSEVYHNDVWFDGHVQGVGFRAHVINIARGYEVTGIVRNLVDGRVFIQAEGTEKEVSEFLVEVKRQLACYIRKEEVREFWGAPCFTGFHIKP